MQRTTRSQLREGDRPWGGRLSEIRQLTDRNLIEGQKDGLSVHNFTKILHSILGVNGAVGRRRFQCLPTEISSTCDVLHDIACCAVMHGMIDEKTKGRISVEETSLPPSNVVELARASSLLWE